MLFPITLGLMLGHFFTVLIHIESAFWCTDRNYYQYHVPMWNCIDFSGGLCCCCFLLVWLLLLLDCFFFVFFFFVCFCFCFFVGFFFFFFFWGGGSYSLTSFYFVRFVQ